MKKRKIAQIPGKKEKTKKHKPSKSRVLKIDWARSAADSWDFTNEICLKDKVVVLSYYFYLGLKDQVEGLSRII